MMEGVRLPPFESLYLEHRDEVYSFLVRRLGRDRAEDAFQETFLRALRGYDALRHASHLRAWLYTIAARVASDELRRRPALATARGGSVFDGRPEYAELEHLAAELPAKERAAVVLRYGYDLTYADIGKALGSSEEAARAAASSGVRRLRKRRIDIS
jgi:DNA-directed RNA polymerase specialized sigma24 family protein